MENEWENIILFPPSVIEHEDADLIAALALGDKNKFRRGTFINPHH